MTNFVDALVHAELFLLGLESDTAQPPSGPVGPAATQGTPATTTISFSQADYRSAAG